MRSRFNYANVTATLALFFAMSGGALAAKHYLINSTKQINPKVLRALKGNMGPTGASGLTGKEGPAGKEGPPGKEGPQGKEGKEGPQGTEGKEGGPAVTLAKGQTEVGGYSAWGTAAEEGFIADDVNFRIPLSGSLDASHVHFIKTGESPTAECPGKHQAPAAASGNLCVYETFSGGSSFQHIFPNSAGVGSGSDPYGFGIYFTVSGKNGVWNLGTWAVTG
jgi:hypothetical protein